MRTHITQPWFIRKAAQYLIGLGILAFVAFDVIDQAGADAAMQTAQENIIPLIGAALNIFAGTKTNPGSDSKVTEQDVATARQEALVESVGGLAESVARQVGQRVEGILSPARPEAPFLPVYSGPTSM